MSLQQAPANDDPPAPGMTNQGKAVAALVGGLTLLIGLLTALVTANGEIGRMFRNSEPAAFWALVLILAAMFCGYLTYVIPASHKVMTTVVLVLGVVALVSAFGVALKKQVDVLTLPDRPSLEVTQQPHGSDLELTAEVVGHKALAHDQIVVSVYGMSKDRTMGSLYYGKSGPDTEGTLKHDVHLVVDPANTVGVYVSAVVVPETSPTPPVNCDGFVLGPDGNPQVDEHGKVSFRPDNQDPLVTCETVTLTPS